jgi:hypothetical protein
MPKFAHVTRLQHDDLSPASIQALRRALRSHLSPSAPRGVLRPAITTICAEARQREITPERLLVIIKEMWRVLPEVQNLPRGAERDGLLERVITISIEEFFGRPV